MFTMSKSTSRTTRATSADSNVSTDLLTRAGFITTSGGSCTWLGLGTSVLRRVQDVIRSEMDALSEEVVLATLQERAWWERSGRSDAFGDETMRLRTRKGREMVLGATAEEAFVATVARGVQSHRDLGTHGYQIGVKYRDELRVRGGLMRAREFIMKDGYSLHLDEAEATRSYEEYCAAYERVFARCGVEVTRVAASSGAMGGSSHEFLARCVDGDDELDGVTVAEVGHVFALGSRYTDAFDVSVLDASGARRSVLMNCYGIGVSRLVAVMAAQNADAAGMRWAREVSVADVHVLGTSDENRVAAAELASSLERAGLKVILDDRGVRAGVALADADLIGASSIVTVGRGWKDGVVEVKDRWSGERRELTASALVGELGML